MEKDGVKKSGDKINTSKELLSVTGDGSSTAVIQNLLKKPLKGSSTNKPKTFKVERSALLDQVASFLPRMRTSTDELLARPSSELQQLDIENTSNDSKVVEMNLLMGEMGEGESEEASPYSSTSDSDSDSTDSESEFGKVTEESLRLPSSAQRYGNRNLIQETHDETTDDGERSDGEVTVASTSSGER